ncbi:hypothetical protein LCGC14_2644100, partial [marine sediment metagenome]
DQEYMCSFDAAIHGAIYAVEIAKAKEQGRVCIIRYNPEFLVHTAWDIGIGDPTAIWFYQKIAGEVRFIDYYESQGEAITHYLEVLKAKSYKYDTAWMPHDADHRQLATGKSIADFVRKNGFNVRIAPKLSVEFGINSARLLIEKCFFDNTKCKAGLDALINYRWDYNKRLEELKKTPLHDWSSHGSDAFRYGAVSITEDMPIILPPPAPQHLSF